MIEDGSVAPDFELGADDGRTVRLSRLKGKPVVIYFYPRDDTPGCTIEARDFTALAADFKRIGVEVLGISPDSIDSHCKFRDKHGLGVTLLADEEKTAAGAYGVWVEKSMYGKTYMGIERTTLLIDAKGRIARSWRKVKVAGHAAEVLAAARSLGT